MGTNEGNVKGVISSEWVVVVVVVVGVVWMLVQSRELAAEKAIKAAESSSGVEAVATAVACD